MTQEQAELKDQFQKELIELLNRFDAIMYNNRHFECIEVEFNWQHDSSGTPTRKGFDFSLPDNLP